MALLSKKIDGGGIMDVIRCDEPSYLIWKWHPEGTASGLNRRENSIRWGSVLRVKPGSVAVFVYPQADGSALEYIEGPFDKKLETENLPVLTNLVGLAYAGNTPFQAEVYFINTAQLLQSKFAVPYFDVYDPRFLDYGVPVAVRGSVNFCISDYRKFINLHSLNNVSIEDFQRQIKDVVSRYVKDVVTNTPEKHNIPVVQLERKISDINSFVETEVATRLFDEFGVTVTSLDISAIDLDKTSVGYKELKAVTKDITTQTVQAKVQVDIKDMKDQQKLGVFQKAAKIFTDIKANAYERKLHTETNYAQTAENNRAGFIGAAGAKILSAYNKNSENKGAVLPPPIPHVSYYVALNGTAFGPFDHQRLAEMVASGDITKETLAWKEGMENWKKVNEIDELADLFPKIPAIPK